MAKIRVLSQAERPSTSQLESAWAGKQIEFSQEDPSKYQDTNDEVTIIDNATGNMFTMFMKPDGTAMMVQPVVIKYERQPLLTVQNLPDGTPNWQGVLDAAGIQGSAYTVESYGPGTSAPNVTAGMNIYKRALMNLFRGYSAKAEYLRSEENV